MESSADPSDNGRPAWAQPASPSFLQRVELGSFETHQSPIVLGIERVFRRDAVVGLRHQNRVLRNCKRTTVGAAGARWDLPRLSGRELGPPDRAGCPPIRLGAAEAGGVVAAD